MNLCTVMCHTKRRSQCTDGELSVYLCWFVLFYWSKHTNTCEMVTEMAIFESPGLSFFYCFWWTVWVSTAAFQICNLSEPIGFRCVCRRQRVPQMFNLILSLPKQSKISDNVPSFSTTVLKEICLHVFTLRPVWSAIHDHTQNGFTLQYLHARVKVGEMEATPSPKPLPSGLGGKKKFSVAFCWESMEELFNVWNTCKKSALGECGRLCSILFLMTLISSRHCLILMVTAS